MATDLEKLRIKRTGNSYEQIPGPAPGDVAPPAQRPNALRDTELGRNVGNAMNAMGGMSAVTRTASGLRAAAAAPKGLPVASAGMARIAGQAAPRLAGAPAAEPVTRAAAGGVLYGGPNGVSAAGQTLRLPPPSPASSALTLTGDAGRVIAPTLPQNTMMPGAVANASAAGLRTAAGVSAFSGFNEANRPAGLVLPTTAAAPAAAQPTTEPSATDPFNDRRFEAGRPAEPPAPLDNDVTRVGNSFSGTNIREGFTTNGQASRNPISTVPGFDFAAADRLREQNAGIVAAQRRIDGQQYNTAAGVIRDSGARDSERFQAKAERDRMLSTLENRSRLALNSRERQAAGQAFAQLSNNDQQAALDSNERVAGLRNAGENFRTTAQTQAQERIAQGNQAVTLRGQDVDADIRGRIAQTTARTAAAKAAQDQANEDRKFKMESLRFGVEEARARREERSSRETQLQRNIEAANVDRDGNVDKNAAAAYRRGIDRSVARMGAEGVQDLSPLDEQRLFAASDLLKTIQANSGMLPWKPDQLKTIDPYDLTNLRVLSNGDRQITRPGKAAGQIIPARFFNTEEGVRFFGGTATNKYDLLQEGAQ